MKIIVGEERLKAAVLRGAYDLKVVDVEDPVPAPGQVLVRVKRCGICGSDLHAYKGRHPDFVLPVIPGHEFSGDVVEVGPEVEGIEVGDRVAVEPLKVCGRCRFCLMGEYNKCIDLKVLGAQTDGAFAELVAVDSRWVYKLPSEVSYEEGAMVEPLAVAVHAVKRALPIGDSVVVLGAGTIGLLTLQVANAFGASNIIVTDLVDWRLELAKKLGATATVNPREENLKDVTASLTNGYGADTVFEAVGSAETLGQSLEVSRKGGKIVVIGVFEEPAVKLNIMNVVNKELSLLGSLVYCWDFENAISLIRGGKVDVGGLVSGFVTLEELPKGFQRMLSREVGVVKIQAIP